MKMGWRSETHTIFSSGEECKSGPHRLTTLHKFTHLCRHWHTPLAPTQPHTSPTQSPSPPAQPPAITMPPTAQKQLTNISCTNIHISVHYAQHPLHNIPGAGTATAGDIPTYPRHCTTADTATGDHISNTPAIIPAIHRLHTPNDNTCIITQTSTSNLSPPSPTQPPPAPSTRRPLAGTATGDNHSNTLVTHAPAATATLLPSYPRPSMPTLHR